MGVPYNILPTLCLKIFAIKLWGEVAQVGKWKADRSLPKQSKSEAVKYLVSLYLTIYHWFITFSYLDVYFEFHFSQRIFSSMNSI